MSRCFLLSICPLSVTLQGFFFGSDTLIAPGNQVATGKEALLAEVEDYMSDARATCVAVMRAIVGTGLLSNLPKDACTPEAFVARYLADPVYMLKVRQADGGRWVGGWVRRQAGRQTGGQAGRQTGVTQWNCMHC